MADDDKLKTLWEKLVAERDPRRVASIVTTMAHDHGEEMTKSELFFVLGNNGGASPQTN